MIDEDDVSLYIYGYFHGYPRCCIDDFVSRFGDAEVRSYKKLWGTGYVPCEKCNKKSEKELINVINSNRLSPLPFPEEVVFDPYDDIDEQFLIALTTILDDYKK